MRNGNFFWWIQSVYVAETAAPAGSLSRALRTCVEGMHADKNVIGVRLYVEHDNRVAQETYRQLGMAMMSYQLMQKYPLHG